MAQASTGASITINRSPSSDTPLSQASHGDVPEGTGHAHFHLNTNIQRPRVLRERRTHSHVSINFFDEPGFHELERAMGLSPSHDESPNRSGSRHSESPDSAAALNTGPDEPFDFERALRFVIRRREAEKIKSRTLGVAFEKLHVVGLGASASFQPTLGSVLDPLNILKAIQTHRHPPLRDILVGFEGVVRPGEMLLVLGRPGSGCSTLLKVLANHRHEYYEVEGQVYYDALTPQQIKKRYRGDVQYCPEDDILFPTLTVDQTILFASKTRAPQTRILGNTRSMYTRKVTDIFETIFGLRHAKDTPVGDAAIRGVSGGEKKRVSISETLASRNFIGSWDNSTRGLDASTALEFVRALRIATDLMREATIVSIYQAGETLWDVFDKVCFIYEGRMVYYGPTSLAGQYFIDMGYIPANRQTTADFLVAVTDPLGRTAVDAQNDTRLEEFRGKPIPKNALEFEEYYQNSDIRRLNLEDIESYKNENVGKRGLVQEYKQSAKEEHARHTRRASPYTISILMQIRIVMLRRAQIMKGNFTSQALSTMTFVLQSVIIGTTFLKIKDDTAAYFSRGGVLFFSLFLPALFSMSEIPALFAQRPIILRHQKAAMYHPMVEALAMTLVDVPFTLVTMIFFTIILYFVVGLQRSASQYFTFFVFIVVVAISMKAFFRGLAAMFSSPAPAQAIAGIFILPLSLYTGYQIPRPSMIGALRWISYINPLYYAFSGLMANEFHTLNGQCSNLVPSGPGYEGVSINNQVCAVVGAEPGQSTVNGNAYIALSFEYYYGLMWRNFAILCAFGVFFLLCLLIFTEINTTHSGRSGVLLFKRGSKATVVKQAESVVGDDEESRGKAVENKKPPGTEIKELEESGQQAKEALSEQPKMQNVFSWQNLSYVIPSPHGDVKLLDDVSGYVVPGKLTALMGESGAGKTTLLNVLAEQVSTGVVHGDRFFNGQALPKDFQAQTGYCQQMDTHFPLTTVREALVFSARLRQPRSVPQAEKDAYAEKCLKMCGLEPFADAIVGTLGVEHKRGQPLVLNLLPSIHQPSAELFQVFDRLLLLMKGGKTVYFGDLGHNAATMLGYFEAAGAKTCQPQENPAEYMLDVIGAGATATTDRDWHQAWLDSEQRGHFLNELDEIHSKGRENPPVHATLKSEFAMPWLYQTKELLIRQHISYWRNPTYLLSKMALNIIGGLFIGFSFFKSKDSIQDSQNKLFAIFMATVLSAPLGGQLHVPYINTRDIYEIRERPSRIYHWAALTTTQILVEILWNIIGATFFFCCWYWTVGFESSRAAFTYLMYGFSFPIYYTTIALAVASMSPTAEIASLMFSFLFSFVLTFEGVVQPYRQLGWWRWMYHLSPFTYLIEALLGQAVGRQLINCSSTELVSLTPPGGETCGTYLAQFIATRGGYVTDPSATDVCRFCSSRTTDEWMGAAFNIYYKNRWRDVGLFWCYIVFNAVLVIFSPTSFASATTVI